MKNTAELEKRIGYRFRNPELLAEALRHASTLGEKDGEHSYERLEYLGDAVLNLCIAEATFHRFPEAGEGDLSKRRAAVINNRNLFRVGQRIGVSGALRIDPSVREKGGGVTRKMIADTVEAITGAIFLDGGFDAARRFVLSEFRDGPPAEELAERFDAKSRLQERCQRTGVPLPRYRVKTEDGPPHARTFTASVRLADGREAEGTGNTKKEAEMDAAVRLLATLPEEEE